MQKSHRQFMCIGLFISILLFFIFWGWIPVNLSKPNCRFAQNAAWISVDWTSKPINETAIKQLAENAASRNIKYLFPYVSYLKSDGSFSLSYNHAKDFVTTFGKYNKNTHILAWIGLPLVNHRSIGVQGWVDLSDQDTRKQIVIFISNLLLNSNFYGVHINAETVQNNDPNFLYLLDEIKQNIGEDKIISVASSYWYPDFINILPGIHNFRWTGTYYQEVGQRVEQIVTMTYDSYTFHPVVYRLWMREQVKGISASLENYDVDLLIGISVSQEKTNSHSPAVENLTNGLAGICAGITDQQTVQGIAIYADWEFSQEDWQVWQALQR